MSKTILFQIIPFSISKLFKLKKKLFDFKQFSFAQVQSLVLFDP